MASEETAVEGGPAASSVAWTAWALIFGLLQGAGLVWAFAGFWRAYPADVRGFVVIPTLLLAAWLATLIHELGHAMGAVLSGWRVAVFAVGPWGIHLVNRRFAYIRRSKRAEMEGFVLPLPGSGVVFTRTRSAIIDAAGPAISVLVAVLGIATGLSASRSPDLGSDPDGLALGFGVLSLIVAARTILPTGPNDHSVDGQRLLRRLRMDDAAWRRIRAITYLSALTHFQVRLRDLPLWMLAEAKGEAAKNEDVNKAYDCIVIGIVLDSRPVDRIETRKLLDSFRAKHGGSPWLDSCDAYFTAVWEGDADRARARLWVGEAEEEMRPMLLAADAAVQARSGDAESARLLLAQMRKAVRKQSAFPDLTFRDIEREIDALLPA